MYTARHAIQGLVPSFHMHLILSRAGERELDRGDLGKAMIQITRAPVQGYPRMSTAADGESEQDYDVMLAAANR
jgi:hypothetical protein